MFENVLVEISVDTFLCIFHNFGRSLNCNFTPKLINVLGQTSRTVLFPLEITAGCYEAKFLLFANARFSGKKTTNKHRHMFFVLFSRLFREKTSICNILTLCQDRYIIYIEFWVTQS